MLKHTKIVATVSDQRCEVEFIRSLYKAGMNVVRLNSAHMVEEGFNRVVGNTRAVSNHIALLMDTKGPEIRTTKTAQPLELKTGDRIKVMGNPDGETTRECICLSYKNFVADMSVGGELLIDDGDLDLKVIEKHSDYLVCEALNDATLGSRKSVNVPGVRISLPSLTEKDRTSILYCIKNNLDFIAHSFVRCKQYVLDIQRILDEHNSPIKIIAKIENQEGIDNIDEILEVAYGIMIARGDLGIEVPQEKIPGIQRMLIKKCVEAKKPVIVATQMLHTMIAHPRPTRAEVTDVANAIYYRTDALMLSGETAYGKYPVEAVQTMAKIAEEAEKTKLSENDSVIPMSENCSVREFLSRSAIEATQTMNVKGIITDSSTGITARNLAAFRGPHPVLAICYEDKLQRLLSLSYGNSCVYHDDNMDKAELFEVAVRMLRQMGYVSLDDRIAYLSGNMAEGGNKKMFEILTVREVFKK